MYLIAILYAGPLVYNAAQCPGKRRLIGRNTERE
jgi:hypothetical protein